MQFYSKYFILKKKEKNTFLRKGTEQWGISDQQASDVQHFSQLLLCAPSRKHQIKTAASLRPSSISDFPF